ncbi:hypothetical protein [Aeromicrobium stalagmiti]|uniref:hypothetical protein n=1 Tax=Aeromicrobium stalagmiti TaxID=2738988 RepID=UPI001567E275|nr:hypothetical protein [Aeromicrobium stalagmiti]NRQ48299.1 hypothetical protein [Aeromicrobium stalagmiti]
MQCALATIGSAAAILVLSACTATTTASVGAIERARLDPVQITSSSASPAPPRFARTTVVETSLAGSTAALDRCAGPVAVALGDDRPVLVAEHDYCGGSAWISRLRLGDTVQLDGAGVEADTYVVTEIGTDRRGEAKVKNLPAADVVLQTCISPEDIVLVGVERLQPALRG